MLQRRAATAYGSTASRSNSIPAMAAGGGSLRSHRHTPQQTAVGAA
jgi:hypothetical protein